MKITLKAAAYVTIALSMGLANTAIAFEPGDWLIRAGVSVVDPKSENDDVVSVSESTSATFNFTYMMTDIWGLELLLAYPFEHDITLLDRTEIGSTKQLPPTLSIQYHFRPTQKLQPYWGVGLNYTTFSSEKTTGPIEGTRLSLGSSWGWAGQVGFDVLMNDDWFFNLDVRYISMDTKATLDGVSLGTVKLDPWVYGAHIGYRF